MTIQEFTQAYIPGRGGESILMAGRQVLDEAEEIRIRVGQPLLIRRGDREYTGSYRPTREDITLILQRMSSYSLYAYNEEICRGYLTLQGGYRVGLCGSAVYEAGRVRALRDITSLNIRISREVKGCGDGLVDRLIYSGGLLSTLIISPPGCGKTTLLRDIIRQISDRGLTVGLVDERSEIGGGHGGVIYHDLGTHTDVLEACPKGVGMYMLLRSMSPAVIAADEIGAPEEGACIREIVNSGVSLLCTIHGGSVEELMLRPVIRGLMEERLFKRYILLGRSKGVGTVEEIREEGLRELCL